MHECKLIATRLEIIGFVTTLLISTAEAMSALPMAFRVVGELSLSAVK
jgi:hypothetical protein